MKNETQLYVIELDSDERMWLSELVDSRVQELNTLLHGAIGDDRESWLKEVGIAECVNEEACLQVIVPERCFIEARDADHAAALAKAEERCRVLEEALRSCKDHCYLDGIVHHQSFDRKLVRAALEGK